MPAVIATDESAARNRANSMARSFQVRSVLARGSAFRQPARREGSAGRAAAEEMFSADIAPASTSRLGRHLEDFLNRLANRGSAAEPGPRLPFPEALQAHVIC